jgi:hypothetical protein
MASRHSFFFFCRFQHNNHIVISTTNNVPKLKNHIIFISKNLFYKKIGINKNKKNGDCDIGEYRRQQALSQGIVWDDARRIKKKNILFT